MDVNRLADMNTYKSMYQKRVGNTPDFVYTQIEQGKIRKGSG